VAAVAGTAAAAVAGTAAGVGTAAAGAATSLVPGRPGLPALAGGRC